MLYFSRSCSKDERKWDTRELELLAAIETLEHLQYYIDGQRVTLETDHNNLRWIMNIKNPQGKLARWITRLSCYDVHFLYRKGECSEVADCISRNALRMMMRRLGREMQQGPMEVPTPPLPPHVLRARITTSQPRPLPLVRMPSSTGPTTFARPAEPRQGFARGQRRRGTRHRARGPRVRQAQWRRGRARAGARGPRGGC